MCFPLLWMAKVPSSRPSTGLSASSRASTASVDRRIIAARTWIKAKKLVYNINSLSYESLFEYYKHRLMSVLFWLLFNKCFSTYY